MGSSSCPAAVIIGAGPYGLSVAAHLRFRRVEFRIFGRPLQQWQANMPRAMLLKSEGCASNLFEPTGTQTLERYCQGERLPYAEYGRPVSREIFTRYALSFQRQLVPDVEQVFVNRLEKFGRAFQVTLATGEVLTARIVVVATGMSYTAYIPSELAGLPEELISHSGVHYEFDHFRGRDVTVVGRGQSALEAAALLNEAGANVRLLVRQRYIRWNEAPILRRSIYDRVRRPMSALGPGIGPWFYSNAPMVFHRLPSRLRVERVRNTHGPAGAWWLRERVMGRVPVMLDRRVRGVETCGGRVLLHTKSSDGVAEPIMTDHVIVATGYRFSVSKLPFISEALLSSVRCTNETPVMSQDFESSVPGLYFTGLASANQFGPAMRFLCGAQHTARRISRHISDQVDKAYHLTALPPATA